MVTIPIVSSKDDLSKYIKDCYLEYIKKLYDKNIHILGIDAYFYDKKVEDDDGEFDVYVDLSSFNKRNKKVFETLKDNNFASDEGIPKLVIKVSTTDIDLDISEGMNIFDKCFSKQDIMYGIYTYDELRNEICKHNVIDPYKFNEEYIEEFKPDIYYDRDTNLFYENEELYRKHIDYISKEEQQKKR